MNRNSHLNYSASQFSNSNPYKTVAGPFRQQNSRSPLYPIGPTLTQPEFKPVQRGVSPYVSRQGVMPPSYQQRYLHQSTSTFMNVANPKAMGRQYDPIKIDYEERQRDIIARNQAEIEEEHKRRQQIRLSYERQINNKGMNLARNLERKQRLLAEIDSLQTSHEGLHEKLMELHPPTQNLNTYQPLDRKQQEMIIMKNKLISQMREKEEELMKEQDEEEKYWEQEITQKERILLKLEGDLHEKRIQVNLQKNSIQKPDFFGLENDIRQEKYNDFVFEATEIENKITRLAQERTALTTEVAECMVINKPILHNLRLKHEDLMREKEEIMIRANDLSRIGKEMEEANKNLLMELFRKNEMIDKYQSDIEALKNKKIDQENSMTRMFKEARAKAENSVISGLEKQISAMQDDLRLEQSTTNKLKTQYQRLYELLCSSTNKNLHQTFNSVLSSQFSYVRS